MVAWEMGRNGNCTPKPTNETGPAGNWPGLRNLVPMKILYALALTIVASSSYAQEVFAPKYDLSGVVAREDSSTYFSPKLDERYGFKGIKFGTLSTAIKNLKWIKKDRNGLQYYQRLGESKELAGEPVTRTEWIFYRNRLYAVLVQVSIFADSERVLRLLSEAYGEPYTPDEIEPTQYLWSGRRSTALFSRDDDTMSWNLFIHSRSASEQREIDRDAALKRAADKL